MEPFEISRTEALLLGLCLGEFQEDRPLGRFLAHLRRRLEAFVPDFGFLEKWLWPNVPATVLSGSSIVFVEMDDNVTLGAWSGSSARIIVELHHTNKRVLQAIRDNNVEQLSQESMDPHLVFLRPDRKSLTDLLILNFGECLELSPGESLLRQVASNPEFMNDWNGFVDRYFEAKDSRAALASLVRTTDDNLPQMMEHFRALAEHNECGEQFSTGYLFGQLEGTLQSEQDRIRYLDGDDWADLDGKYVKATTLRLTTLMRYELNSTCHQSASWSKSLENNRWCKGPATHVNYWMRCKTSSFGIGIRTKKCCLTHSRRR